MAAQKEKEQRFDQVKLQGMHEPLTVRVEKIRGNVRQPIELPPKGSEQTGFSPPGTGWTRDEVLQLENFILTKWSGGGYYEFTVTDAKGERMTWQGVWDPRMYPERIPPNTAEAAVVGASPTAMPIAGPQVVPAGTQPLGMQQQTGWPPSGNALGYNNPPHTGPVMVAAPQPVPQPAPAPAPVPAPQAPPMWAQQGPWGQPQQQPQWGAPWQQPYGPGMPGMPPNYGYGAPFQQGFGGPFGGPQNGFGGGGPFGPQNGFGGSFGSSRSRYDDDTLSRRARFFDDDEKRENEKRENEKRELENRLRQAELDRKELEYKSALDRIQTQQQQAMQQLQQQHAQQMQAMQDELRRIGEGRNKGEDEEVRRAREEAQRQREAAQAEQQRLREQAQAERAALERQIAEQSLAQMRLQNEQQVQALREQLARMNDQPKGETDEFRRLREEQDRQAREFERQRQEDQRRLEAERAERERERERYDRERREEALAREMKETREATERRFEQLMTSRNASDPMIDALKETSRMNAESMREMARMQQTNSDKMAAFMVAPAQLAAIMKDNSHGADGVMRGMIQSIGEIGNLYKNAAESVMQMSGGGGEPPAVRLIQEGIGRASEVAERFLAVKRDSVLSEAKVKTAEAARDQTKIQAEASLRSQAMHVQAQAAMAAQGRPPAGWSPPPPVANANSGLGGAQQARPAAVPQARPSTNGHGPQQAQAPTEVQPTAEAAPAAPVERRVGPIDLPPEPPPPPNRTGPTEEEMFGAALDSVKRLRRGVAEGKLDPSKTIDAILQGAEHVVTNGLVIPAFVLFQQERWADFVDIMLPEAPQLFRDECVRILIEEVEPGDPSEPGEPGDQAS
jgi:hypothetical protein